MGGGYGCAFSSGYDSYEKARPFFFSPVKVFFFLFSAVGGSEGLSICVTVILISLSIQGGGDERVPRACAVPFCDCKCPIGAFLNSRRVWCLCPLCAYAVSLRLVCNALV